MINSDAEIALDYLLSPEFELINSAGKPLTGGYIEVYIHGTRNKYYCYSDWAGTLHPFQIPLDSLGSNIVLASPDNAYDVYVYNKYGSLIMSRYNVHCQGTGGGGGSYVGDKLFYGQYTAHNVAEIASLSKTKGNINLDSDGYLQLKQGMSYHITVRGAFQVDDVANTETTLNYIEYSTISPIKVDIDFTKADPQNFELSYDIYDLAEDMAYKVAFEQINGMVTDLVVEVHSLSNLATTATFDYEAGDYISIVDNTISVTGINPEDYSTHSETYESIVTAIQMVTGIMPDDAATHDEVYEATVTAINFVTGIIPDAQVQSDWTETDDTDPSYIQNKPDLDIYATHDEVISAVTSIDLSDYATHTEVYEATVTAVQVATGAIPEEEEIEFEEIDLNDYALASAIPDVSDFTTHNEVYEATITAVQVATGAIPDVSDFATYEDLAESAVTSIQLVTGMIPDVSDFITHDEVNTVSGEIVELTTEIVNNVSGDIIETVNNVSSVLHEEIQNIPEQVQSDWDQTDDTQVDYIKNKPDLDIYATHDEVNTVSSTIIETVNNVSGEIVETVNDVSSVLHEEMIEIGQAATGMIPDVSDYATHDEVHESIVSAVEYVTGMIPEAQVQSDWTETDNTDPSYIQNKPNTTNLVAGDNINIIESSNDLVISCTAIPVVTGFATKEELQDAVEVVTGIIPEAQVQSDWTQNDDTQVDYIKNKPQNLVQDASYVHTDNNFTNLDKIKLDGIEQGATKVLITDVPGQHQPLTIRGGELRMHWGDGLVCYTPSSGDSRLEVSPTIIDKLDGIEPGAEVNVQADWAVTAVDSPAYIQNKPNEYNVVAGDNIGIMIDNDDLVISASGVDLSDYTTFEDVVAMVSGVTGLTEYGQFYSTNITSAATMSRIKGTIEVTNDGKIKLKKGSSYHVTVRGRYNQTTAANTYGDISYIEYITNQSIHVNVDNTIADAQYFELSYDLYKLNNDSNYYVYFSMNGGTVNDLFIEIHSLDGIGGSGTGPVTGGTEYDAGWGIQILNNVISVNPSIIPVVTGYVTDEELQDSIELVTGLIPEAQVQSDWAVTAVDSPAYIQNKPNEKNLIAGANITITETNDDVIVETTEIASGLQLVAGPGVTMTVSGTSLVVSSSNTGSDETVIFSTGSDSSCTLSEPYSNFEKIGIFYGIETDTSTTYCQVPKEQLMLSSDIARLNGWGIWLNDFRCDGNTDVTSLVFRWSRWRFTNSTTLFKELGYQMVYNNGWGSPSSTQFACYISKIIGYNRISS